MTAEGEYTRRLLTEESRWWKRLIRLRLLYGWYLRRQQPGFLLEVGCGLGRNLRHIRGRGVGIDHNAESVAVCRTRGFEAYLPDDFKASVHCAPRRFDSLLLSHVLEHMTFSEAVELVRCHLEYVRPGGRVILVTPQERGFRHDPTHVEFIDASALEQILRELRLELVAAQSFPLPHRPFGRIFRYNEFVTVGRVPV